MVTLKEIANAFGVSPITVSNALNNKAGVSPDKARAIKKYAERIGYRPAYMARSLIRGRTHMIGMCVRENITDPWTAGLLRKIQHILQDNDFYLNVIMADDGIEKQQKSLLFFRELRVEGVIIGPLGLIEEYNALREQILYHKNVIAFDAVEDLPINCVKLDLYSGVQKALEYVLKMGHKNIGYIGVSEIEIKFPSLKSRLMGFVDFLKSNRLPIREEWLVCNNKDWNIVKERLANLIKSNKELPTVWFCHNDVLAAKTISLFYEFGLRVPEDVSIIGFDNQPISQWVPPGIMSVGYDLDEYAKIIANMVINGIPSKEKQHGNDMSDILSEPRSYILPPIIFERKSVKKIDG